MTWWSRWRADLTRPDTSVERRELPFLAVVTAVIVVAGQVTEPGTAAELLLVIAAGVTLVLSAATGRPPWVVVAVVVAVLLAAASWQDGSLEVALMLGVLATLYAAWHLGSVTRALVCLAVAAAGPLVVANAAPDEDIAWIPWTAGNVLTFALGRNLQRQRALIGQLEAAREALADQAVADERQRIARELHDLAGHTMAAVLLHVTGARHVLRRDRDEAERALLQAEAIGRGSLDQIRSTVASLRTSERGTDPALAGAADLVGLVEDYRRAGLDVTAALSSPAEGIDGPVGTALHRISREALANVARHAPENRVELAVDLEPDRAAVRLVVADHGRAAAARQPDDGHFGLLGMRERARALGGRLDAGPTADGWRVEARLPLVPTGGEEPRA